MTTASNIPTWITSLSLECQLEERLKHLEWLASVEEQLMTEITVAIAQYTNLEQQLRDETRTREIHRMLIQKNLNQLSLM